MILSEEIGYGDSYALRIVREMTIIINFTYSCGVCVPSKGPTY